MAMTPVPPKKPEASKKGKEILKDIHGSITSEEYWKGDEEGPYKIDETNWYKTIPYGFRISTEDIGSSMLQLRSGLAAMGAPSLNMPKMFKFFFPVNPENISIGTPFAVQVTPTMGGIVEEHSGAVFYNITISGNTGVLPSIDLSNGITRNPDDLRISAAEKPLIPNLGGFAQNMINTVNSVASKILGADDMTVKATANDNTGYTAFHVLYKFLWLYHQGKANGAPLSLYFVNYKDNNQYKIVVNNFQLTRDKSRPHLYQYSIQMKGWKLETNADKTPILENAEDRLKKLGLEEGPSVKAKMFRVITTAKSTLNAAGGFMNTAAQDLIF